MRCRVPADLDHPLAGRSVCGRLKQENRRLIEDEACLQPPMPNGACYWHGGPSPGPPATANGRYSRLQRFWGELYERLATTDDLLDVKPDLTLMDVAIARRLEFVQSEDAPAWREELRKTYRAMRAAMKSGDKAEMAVTVRRLGELVERGAKMEQAVRDLVTDVDRRAARAQKEREVMLKGEDVVTVRELMRIFGDFIAIVKEHAPADAVRTMVPKFRVVLGATPPPLTEGSREVEADGEADTG